MSAYPKSILINRLFEKMNLLVVAAISIKFKSGLLHAKSVANLYDNFSVFGQIENTLN